MGMSRYPTNFTEANALLAVIEGDIDTAREIIATMLPGERRALTTQAYVLADLLKERDRFMSIVNSPCRWYRNCTDPVIGYYTCRGSHYGICERHAPAAHSSDLTVHDLPKEVTL
jgi:hypothetical protein